MKCVSWTRQHLVTGILKVEPTSFCVARLILNHWATKYFRLVGLMRLVSESVMRHKLTETHTESMNRVFGEEGRESCKYPDSRVQADGTEGAKALRWMVFVLNKQTRVAREEGLGVIGGQ